MNFEQSIVIAADAESLFELSQNYSRRLEWDPFLKSATLLGNSPTLRVGSRALCVAHNGWAMETEYVSLHPPRATAVRMTKGPWFLHRFAGAWRFTPQAEGSTRVTFRYQLVAWPRFLARVLTPILSHHFARDTQRRLEALKSFVERRLDSAASV